MVAQPLFQVVNVGATGLELGVHHQLTVQGHVGVNALDHGFSQRRLHAGNGLVFVEIDYLHESPPTFERLADYSAQAKNAHPYRIVVLDPRPDFHTGPVCLHEFDVDQAIPTVTIPLIGRDQLAFDFDAAYQKTFTDALYGYDLDYRQLPLNFQRYSQADQQRIAAKMVAVLEAVQRGVNLESGPLQAVEMELAVALTQIEEFTHSH